MIRLVQSLLLSLLVILCFAFKSPDRALIDNYLYKSFGNKATSIDYIITSKAPGTNGVEHIYGTQLFNTFPIFGTEFNLAAKDGEVLNFYHAFQFSTDKLKSTTFSLTPLDAFYKTQTSENQIVQKHYRFIQTGNGEYTLTDKTLSDEDIKVRQMWMVLEGKLRAVYEVSMYEKDHSHWYNTRVDAQSGLVINRNDWVTECLFHNSIESHSHTSSLTRLKIDAVNGANKMDAGGSYTVFAYPLESPNHGNRTVVNDAENDDASPFGWHDVNGQVGPEYTITRGNNVYASEDKDADNLPGQSVDGGINLTFNNPFDITKSAAQYTDAAITNLFYWNNLLHDVWWHYGFDEESGNFQQNNYGNGGLGGDYVNADAQDGSGTNNANFATPPDGVNPRMQMFLWNSGTATSDYFQINSPSSLAGKQLANFAAFGPGLPTTPVVGNLVLVDDGSANPDQGCNSLVNSAAVNGNIALIRRRNCNFTVKVKNAQLAGARAVVIYSDDENPITMGGSDNTITIPSIHIRRSLGLDIVAALNDGPVNVSLYDSSNLNDNIVDSDFDNGIITHEYGHGISTRLTGGAANSNCLRNEEQMGEGWSDFFGLVMTHAPDDKGTDGRGIGTYARRQPTNGPGIRPHPYSTDRTISPYNYDDIKSFSVPHGVGSVWCAMLWDLYWAMIDKYGYDPDIYEGTGGNNMAMQLVIDGLKLQKCNPGFVDGRDAILDADLINNNGVNEELIWEVFAARGLGYNASQGSSNDRSDGIEDYSVPPYVKQRLVLTKEAKTSVQNDSILDYTITAYNRKVVTSKDIVISDVLNEEVVLIEESLDCDASIEGNTITWRKDSLPFGDTLHCTFSVRVIFEETTSQLLSDDVESENSAWQAESSLGNNTWQRVGTQTNSGDFSWFIPNDGSQSDYTLTRTIDLTQTNRPVLSFHHWYNTESTWDGGIIEVKNVDDNVWLDVADHFITNGYNTQIQLNPDSRISERMAFSGNSEGFILSQLDLSTFVGQEIELRFRFVSDAAANEEGWYIDDIVLEDAAVLQNNIIATTTTGASDTAGVTTFVYGETSTYGLGIHKLEPKDLTIYPNPASDVVTISSASQEEFSYEMVDISGKQLLSGDGKGNVTLKVHDYVPGVYILYITKAEVRRTYKVMVER